MAKVMVSVADDLLARIDATVRERGTSRSAFLADAATRELARRDPKELARLVAAARRGFDDEGPFESADLVRRQRDSRP